MDLSVWDKLPSGCGTILKVMVPILHEGEGTFTIDVPAGVCVVGSYVIGEFRGAKMVKKASNGFKKYKNNGETKYPTILIEESLSSGHIDEHIKDSSSSASSAAKSTTNHRQVNVNSKVNSQF